MNEVMTLEEVAKYLRCSTKSVRRWAEKKRIPFFRLGNLFRFRMSEINDWVANGGGKTKVKK